MELVNRYLTKDSLYHLMMALPAIIMLAVHGTSLNSEWWFYGVLFVLAILSVLVNIACIVLAAEKLVPEVYAVLRMLSFLLFIPAFCCTVLSVVFSIFGLFGVDFIPNV